MAKIKIKQVRSAINRPARQKATIKALGFSKLNQTVEHEGTPQIFNLAGCQTVPEYHDLPIDCCQEEGGEGREADEVCVWLCQW